MSEASKPTHKLLEWLKANDLNPNDIPRDAHIRIVQVKDEQFIMTEVVVRDEKGNIRQNIAYEACYIEITVPLKVSWEEFDKRFDKGNDS